MSPIWPNLETKDCCKPFSSGEGGRQSSLFLVIFRIGLIEVAQVDVADGDFAGLAFDFEADEAGLVVY